MIYILWAKDTNLYKVGYTTRTVEKRIKELSTGCPYPLVVKGTIEDGTQAQEAEIHKTLKRQGKWKGDANGQEWFALTEEDVVAILGKAPLSAPNRLLNMATDVGKDFLKAQAQAMSRRKGVPGLIGSLGKNWLKK